MRTSLRRSLLPLVFCTCGWVSSAHAAFTSVTFFGDSIVDTGNVLSLTTNFAPPPFPAFPGAEGRFSNGPVWAELFAASLGLPGAAAPSNLIFNGTAVVPIGPAGGQNFSFGGARASLGGSAGATTGLFGQLIAWNGAPFGGALTRAADPNALYSITVGSNDMRDFRSGQPGALSPQQAALDIVNAIGLLSQAGGQHFLVSDVPDLGLTPEAALIGIVPESTAASIAFNAALAAALSLLDATFLASTGIDLDIRTLDLFGISRAVFDDAINHGGETFGITNVTTPCITPGPTSLQFFAPDAVANGCGVSEFADPLEPSSASHRLIALAAERAVGVAAAVPEPDTAVLLVCALMAALGVRRRA